MKPFTTLTAIAAPFEQPNIDTNQLCPTRFNKVPRGPKYARVLFHDLRFNADGSEKEFILNAEPYNQSGVIVADRNFGCGSSRESAAFATLDYGVRALIGASFGDVYRGNCLQSGVLTIVLPPDVVAKLMRDLQAEPGARVTVNLERQEVHAPDGAVHNFDIDAARKARLLKGLDDVGVTLTHLKAIEAFESHYHAGVRWLQPVTKLRG